VELKIKIGASVGTVLLAISSYTVADGWDPGSSATTKGSIGNTRHNLTMNYKEFGGDRDLGFNMNAKRNDYGAVCVYCHTPHGGNTKVDAPLWNRTVNPGNYIIYDKPRTLNRPIGAPGPASLTCLSCHDGTIAIDSVLNMPGSGLDPTNSGLANNSEGTSNIAFLSKWNAGGFTGPPPGQHATLGPELAGQDPSLTVGSVTDTCAGCHNSMVNGRIGSYAAFMLGTDLRNDHPVGILFPDPGQGDFNNPSVRQARGGGKGGIAFFDLNGNSHADPSEVRLYDSGGGYEVECASCHDPHGVPSKPGDPTSRFNPSFLRVNNGVAGTHAGTTGIAQGGSFSGGPSALCLTCHAK